MRKRHLFLLSIFKELNKEQQDLLIPLITLCHFAAGETLFKQGDRAMHLYILESGIVNILFKPSDGPEILVAHLTSGGVFGWSATLGRDSYTSAAHAEMDCEAYCFDGAELRKLCEEYPDTGVVILDRLALAISKRLETTHNKVMGVLNQGMDLNFDLSLARRN
jgi:CRP-like cAMP-binding protein